MRHELEIWPWWLVELANAEIKKKMIFVTAYSKTTVQMKTVESKSMMQFQSQIFEVRYESFYQGVNTSSRISLLRVLK